MGKEVRVIPDIESLKRFFDESPHYRRMAEEERQRLELQEFVRNGPVNDLARRARDLFQLVQNECRGVLRFRPGKTRIWYEGPYCCVDSTGRSKKGAPIGWCIVGDGKKLWDVLHESSEVETEVWRRVNRGDVITSAIEVYDTILSPTILNGAFLQYYRDFCSTYNGKPRKVESAFNHIESLQRSLKVKGFPYPHPVSDIVIGAVA
jgi:hypothetical protein